MPEAATGHGGRPSGHGRGQRDQRAGGWQAPPEQAQTGLQNLPLRPRKRQHDHCLGLTQHAGLHRGPGRATARHPVVERQAPVCWSQSKAKGCGVERGIGDIETACALKGCRPRAVPEAALGGPDHVHADGGKRAGGFRPRRDGPQVAAARVEPRLSLQRGHGAGAGYHHKVASGLEVRGQRCVHYMVVEQVQRPDRKPAKAAQNRRVVGRPTQTIGVRAQQHRDRRGDAGVDGPRSVAPIRSHVGTWHRVVLR